MRMYVKSMKYCLLQHKLEKSKKCFQFAFPGSTMKIEKKNCVCNDNTIKRMSKICYSVL